MSHINDAQIVRDEMYIQISITQGGGVRFFVACFLLQDVLGVHMWCFRGSLLHNIGKYFQHSTSELLDLEDTMSIK